MLNLLNFKKTILLSIVGIFLVANCHGKSSFFTKLKRSLSDSALGQVVSSSATNIKNTAKQSANNALGAVSTTGTNLYNAGDTALSSNAVSQQGKNLINAVKQVVPLIKAAEQAGRAQNTYNNAVVINGGSAPTEAANFKNAVNNFMNVYNQFMQTINNEVMNVKNQADAAH